MTIIDFHTHTFPDRIADATIDHLAKLGNVKPYRRGTLDALKESMRKGGVDGSVVLPVATAVKQVDSINRLSAELNGKDGVFYAGAIHPECENVEDILDGIVAAGLKCIKIHPDYQGVYFDDERYIRILELAARRNLLIVTHAGVDVGFPQDVHCTPDMVLRVLDRLKGIIDGKLILAHMGGCSLPEEVFEKLAGKPVYMDTAFVLHAYPEKCVEIIRKHGADRILFATDSPWADQKQYVEILQNLPLTDEEKAKIFGENAKRLLGIQ
ncbi:MAG: amidohydrolase family protein [Clostridia bacterium]|nr:amidohydrolase family protein [Clostridia bacterium]